MPHKTLTILAHEEELRMSGACADDGRPLAHQVFFEADNWLVPEGYEQLLQAHAAYLSGHPELAAVISGHSYGTGSHRFFWLMGDRRAIAVRAALLKAGAAPEQLLAQSQGAARPLIEMAGEDVGRYRRRVTIDYLRLDAVAAPPVPPDGSAQWWRSVMGGGIQLPPDRLGSRIS
ncbi:MAG TPA: OmpA family protein [Polaromonas sp.]|uniref:OmpA family protein n=1 Tax=Polaromonas sp. TaxID=1869339 RepID=UPI002D4B37EA|nr:OmpA family protein [Polaromonas sp.]HYW58723.1 OmpA family protein [Polaromonas sp.]